MVHAVPRTPEQRKADVLATLSERHADVWVASASGAAEAHLVPLSLAWAGERVIVATESASLTARNVTTAGRARLAAGATRDVVMIDAVLDDVVDIERASPQLADAYARQADWDPRTVNGGFLFLILRPHRIQAWREVNEIAGRTLMRDGAWLV